LHFRIFTAAQRPALGDEFRRRLGPGHDTGNPSGPSDTARTLSRDPIRDLHASVNGYRSVT
jgi:hypothetical protein